MRPDASSNDRSDRADHAADYVTHADLGGTEARGPVVRERDEPPFHAAWEGRALAVTLAAGATGAWNLDMSRSARETLADYSRLSYYEIWVAALVTLLEERKLVLPEEIESGHARHPASPVARVLTANAVPAALAAGSPTVRRATRTAKFAVGDGVRLREGPFAHHTRLPRYAWGRRGRIERVHGVHVFPDSNAQGRGEDPQWLYSVVVEIAESGNDGAGAALTFEVSIDAFEPYLDAP